jgi:hypothetical protein
MRVGLDWKYGLMFFVTILGIAVPWVIWRLDAQSHSLSVIVASQTSISPVGDVQMKGLKLTVDGVEVDRPYLTVLELSNDGARPVLATDFEEPISLTVAGSVKIVRAEISEKAPPELEPRLSYAERGLRISALLLNPTDRIVLSVITAGGEPQFGVRTRIAGIKAIKVDWREQKLSPGAGMLLKVAQGFLLVSLYAACVMGALMPTRRIRRPVLFVAGLALGLTAVRLIGPLLQGLDRWTFYPLAFAVGALAVFVGGFWWVVRPSRGVALPFTPRQL